MATIEQRLRKLVDENLEIEGRPIGSALDLDTSLRDAGLSSVELVAFAKVVGEEFGVGLTPEDCANYKSLGELVAFLDCKSG